MKKYALLGLLFSFFACSSDDSSGGDKVVDPKPPVEVDQVSQVIFLQYNEERTVVNLVLYDPKEDVKDIVSSFELDLQESYFGLIYDDVAKNVYITSNLSDNNYLTTYSLSEGKILSKVTLTPKELIGIPGNGVLTSDNKIISYNREAIGTDKSFFMSIDINSGVVKFEEGSSKLPMYYMNGFCDYFFLDYTNKSELVGLCYMYNMEGETANEYNIVKVDINDFSRFDIETENKVIPLQTKGLSLNDEVGFVQDKLGNYYCAINYGDGDKFGTKVYLVNKSNGSLQEEFAAEEVYYVEYDDKSNSIFSIEYGIEDAKLKFVQYDLTTKTKVRTANLDDEGEIVAMRVVR